MSARALCGQAKICKEAARQNRGVLPVSINNHAGKVFLTGEQGMNSMKMAHPVCEIVFPNGVTVRLSGEISTQMLSQLITIGQ